jgi:exportin-7
MIYLNWHFISAGNYSLSYLYSQPKLTQFVIQGLVSLFARITKLGWFDTEKEEFVFRDVITDVSKFLQVSQFRFRQCFSRLIYTN